jgi:hypothetical protein
VGQIQVGRGCGFHRLGFVQCVIDICGGDADLSCLSTCADKNLAGAELAAAQAYLTCAEENGCAQSNDECVECAEEGRAIEAICEIGDENNGTNNATAGGVGGPDPAPIPEPD